MLLSSIPPYSFHFRKSQPNDSNVSPSPSSTPPTTITAVMRAQPAPLQQPFLTALINFAVMALITAVIRARV